MPGYKHFSMLNIFTLYSSRPRVNQIWTGVLRQLVGGVYLRGAKNHVLKGRDANLEKKLPGAPGKKPALHRGTPFADAPACSPEPRPPALGSDPSVARMGVHGRVPGRRRWPSSRSSWCRAVFVGVTWRRFPNAPIREHISSYVNYMLAAPAPALVGWVALPWRHDASRGGPVTCLWQLVAVASVHLVILLPFLAFTGFFTYGVAWRYWAEFLTLPGSLWRPPKFVKEAAVRSTFSASSAAISGL
ncbi:hypothetical protein MAPG_10715 [Magnaporthiopsis poae ATCC 64411]|uniref:Uncharacterized protein n=1 Tax=Magnaporthiopsis poae (strain ATCC 64411 / 73-15) TaxID=644358 RepID=A0A0C4EDC0_MAGP6|nr:hypothetical protein MAPG_10715 [Magnaporthiopsis poae ATCC 64411]